MKRRGLALALASAVAVALLSYAIREGASREAKPVERPPRPSAGLCVAFPHEFTAPGDLVIVRDAVTQDFNAALILIPSGRIPKIFADSVEVGTSEVLAREELPEGLLVAIRFRSEIAIFDGDSTASLKLGPDAPRQTIGVDATAPAVKFIYLKKGEGCA